MTAARNFVLYNPDSHLAGYHRNLVKGGMAPMEATKRVARALVRVIYRKLRALVEDEAQESKAEEQKGKTGEGDMASGSLRSEQSHTSNMPPSSLATTTAGPRQVVKTVAVRARRTNSAGDTFAEMLGA